MLSHSQAASPGLRRGGIFKPFDSRSGWKYFFEDSGTSNILLFNIVDKYRHIYSIFAAYAGVNLARGPIL